MSDQTPYPSSLFHLFLVHVMNTAKLSFSSLILVFWFLKKMPWGTVKALHIRQSKAKLPVFQVKEAVQSVSLSDQDKGSPPI